MARITLWIVTAVLGVAAIACGNSSTIPSFAPDFPLRLDQIAGLDSPLRGGELRTIHAMGSGEVAFINWEVSPGIRLEFAIAREARIEGLSLGPAWVKATPCDAKGCGVPITCHFQVIAADDAGTVPPRLSGVSPPNPVEVGQPLLFEAFPEEHLTATRWKLNGGAPDEEVEGSYLRTTATAAGRFNGEVRGVIRGRLTEPLEFEYRVLPRWQSHSKPLRGTEMRVRLLSDGRPAVLVARPRLRVYIARHPTPSSPEDWQESEVSPESQIRAMDLIESGGSLIAVYVHGLSDGLFDQRLMMSVAPLSDSIPDEADWRRTILVGPPTGYGHDLELETQDGKPLVSFIEHGVEATPIILGRALQAVPQLASDWEFRAQIVDAEITFMVDHSHIIQDGHSTIAFARGSGLNLVVTRANVPHPAGPQDWSRSTLTSGGAVGGIELAGAPGLTVVAFDQKESVHLAYRPGGADSTAPWTTLTLAQGAGFSFNRALIVDRGRIAYFWDDNSGQYLARADSEVPQSAAEVFVRRLPDGVCRDAGWLADANGLRLVRLQDFNFEYAALVDPW